MRSLRDCLKVLYDSTKDLDPELGVQIIILAVKLTREQALRWIEVFGNPSSTLPPAQCSPSLWD
jgi:hypothetical protein